MDGHCLRNYLYINLNGKNTSKFNEKFITNYDEEIEKGYMLEANVAYLKNLYDSHNDLPFLPERMKIKNCNRLV